MSEAIIVKPSAIRADVLLTTTQPTSHHDAAVQDGSNMLLFNRQKQIVPRPVIDESSGHGADVVVEAFPVPVEFVETMNQLTTGEFIAVAVAKTFIDEYNSYDGAGLFTGMDRYERLETRIRHGASRTASLRTFWDWLVTNMNVPIHRSSLDKTLALFFGLKRSEQFAALAAVQGNYRSITSLARYWAAEKKAETAVAKPSGVVDTAGAVVVEVPAISGNSLRHTMVRAPLWDHLSTTLGIEEAFPGQAQLPPGVEAIFVNGGNIAAGAKQMQNAHALAERVRQTFPGLDLLGGVCDSFDLGESRLTVTPYLVCRENRTALQGLIPDDSPMLEVSAFDLVGDETHTRQATAQGVGQMIYNFETLAAGAQIYVRFALQRGTPLLTQGALAVALDWFASVNPHVGGQKRAGFGACVVDIAQFDGWDAAKGAYEDYLASNAEDLKAALVTGTMGTEKAVLS